MHKSAQLSRLETLLKGLQAQRGFASPTLQALSEEAIIVQTMLNLEQAIAGEQPAKATNASPVIYVDENSQIVSRVSPEQLEAIFGPAVDAIRASFKEQEGTKPESEEKPRDLDSTGAMASAWFGTPAPRAVEAVFGRRSEDLKDKYSHESVWDAINKYTTARDALAARRAKGELMNAEFVEAENNAVVAVDEAIFRVRAKAQRPTVTPEMVNRFLGWKLPKDFFPDCGISFDGRGKEYDSSSYPIGTNLLTAEQAKAMLEHVLGVTGGQS